MTKYGVILVTVDTQERGQAIAGELVKDRLAACVNLFPVYSIYTWEGAVQQEDEWQLVIKTDLNLFTAIETQLKTLHPYEVPEILALPIYQGAHSYLNWMTEQVSSPPIA